LPLIVLDATGMRLGELEGLRWGDVDEPRGRWRVSKSRSEDRTRKMGHGPPPGSAPLLPERAPQPGCRRSRHTTSATAGSACCTWAGCRGRGSASTSGNATSPSPRTRTRTSWLTNPSSTWRRSCARMVLPPVLPRSAKKRD